MTLGPYLASWNLHLRELPAALPAWLSVANALLVVAAAACRVRLLRQGRRYEAAFAVVTAAAALAVVVSARGIAGPFNDYLLVWAPAVGALGVAVVLATLLPPPGPPDAAAGFAFVRRGGLALAVVCAWSVVGGLRLERAHAREARDTSLRALATDLGAYCERHGIARPLLAFAGDAAWGAAVGIVLQFDKRDRPIAIADTGLFLVGAAFARTGREEASFFVMPTAGASLPADAARSEWITTRGEYRIVRIR
jgi:hypothetical protein